MRPEVRTRHLFSAVAVLVAIGHGPLPLHPTTHAQQSPPVAAEFVPGQVVVQFRRDAVGAARVNAARVIDAERLAAIGPDSDGLELLRTTRAVADSIAALQALPEVEFAEPNWIVRLEQAANDPYYTNGSLWGMYGDTTAPSNPFGSHAGKMWGLGYTGRAEVMVGIIDSGISIAHPDLAPNIWTNPYDPVDGIDNDSNGYVDDVNGWDFFNGDRSVYDGTSDSHGTHVAGTIGARGGNGQGVAGVNWHVTMIPAKFVQGTSGPISAAVSAIKYLTDLKVRHQLNIVATNNSWGTSGASMALHQAIIQAAKQNILFVAAAGNATANNDLTPNYPSNYSTNVAAGTESAAGYDAVIAVASMTSTGALSSFSNFGPTTVDIGAPGSNIWSTWPPNGYSPGDGTSMATPHVTGAVALYQSINPNASPQQIRDAILGQGLPTASLAGRTTTGRRLSVGEFAQPPAISIEDASVNEGDAGTTTATFRVSLSRASGVPVTVNYATGDGTASSSASTPTTTLQQVRPITIPAGGHADPYPSTITVPAGLGGIAKLRVHVTGLAHTFPQDIDMLLVGPTGRNALLMSDAGGGSAVAARDLIFDDAGAPLTSGPLVSGTYRPTNLDDNDPGNDFFDPPAPFIMLYGSSLATFNGTDPTGQWRLFIRDDFPADGGSLAGGWALEISTAVGPDYLGTAGMLTIPAGASSATISVTVNGDLAPEPPETFTVTLSAPVGATIADGLSRAVIRNDDFTDHPLGAGLTMKAAHVTELRTMINGIRALRGVAPVTFTDAALAAEVTAVKAIHVTELRSALSAVCAVPPFTDPGLTAHVSAIRAAHVMELRLAAISCQ